MSEKYRWPIRTTLAPGKNGTKREHNEYLDRLVCVRYRFSADGKTRIKTVEIIVDQSPVARDRKSRTI